MTQLKVRQIGNSLGVVLPKEILTCLNVKSGDSLHRGPIICMHTVGRVSARLRRPTLPGSSATLPLSMEIGGRRFRRF